MKIKRKESTNVVVFWRLYPRLSTLAPAARSPSLLTCTTLIGDPGRSKHSIKTKKATHLDFRNRKTVPPNTTIDPNQIFDP